MTTNPTTSELIELAARCEQATGPNFQLEQDIGAATDWDLPTVPAPNYTASIDAARRLVPEGWSFTLYAHLENAHCDLFKGHPSKGLIEVEDAATPALALTAACLRARSQTKEG